MKKDFLFIVHVEPMFEQWMGDDFLFNLGKYFDDYHTIILESGISEEGDYDFLLKAANEVWDWSWGYEHEGFCYQGCKQDDDGKIEHVPGCDGVNVIPSGSPHEWTWVPTEIRDRVHEFTNGRKVFISGGGESECLYDWEEVLDHLGIQYQKIHDIIY